MIAQAAIGFSLLLLLLAVITGGSNQKYPNVPTLRVKTKEEDIQLYLKDVMELLRVGYQKYSKQGRNYLLDLPKGKYFVASHHYLDEIMRAPPSHVNAPDAQSIMTQTAYTISAPVANDQWHMNVPVRKNLMLALTPSLEIIVAEARAYLDEQIGQPESTSVLASDFAFDIVVRTANRVLFGKQLARDPRWKRVCVEYSEVMFAGANKIRFYPNFLKRIALWFTSDIRTVHKLAEECTFPVISERLEKEQSFRQQGRDDTWEQTKPSDAIQWVIDAAPQSEKTPNAILDRLLHITTATVHTTSFTFLDILHCLSLTKEYTEELRTEITEVFRAEGGWSKQGLTHMAKVDSYVTEVTRWCPMSGLKLARLALKDWTMKDGTLVPKGTIIFLNEKAIYDDEEIFDSPKTFNPWRMYQRRQKEGEAQKHQWVMASPTHLHFGYSKHACPGRFFASNEIKVLIALLIMRYDVSAIGIPGGLAQVAQGYWGDNNRVPIMGVKLELKDRVSDIPTDIRQHFI
ncbi:uncharacterized protein Z518_03604 [Rhinocladiella mackenziei CBS 650.93]|uniref:Cytochrome P450 n=1 Tax=Rhinocladiella mackenziei CBS 650.93 TaxID=1442369 RepID=A0A0D2FU51_9EURO|nr:uncharacterized protein Z518_03604 [Rhinocladiella mackenziei CBS 650.93]KIX05632.1 hypothetical protein Z518_03604 [Rhinocladiella mackenziei CBS 650.93]